MWKVTECNRLVLFGYDYGNPTQAWKRESFEELLPNFYDKMQIINALRTDSDVMSVEALSVESHVALGFFVNGDLTLEHLQGSIEDPDLPKIRIPRFFKDDELPMDIRRSQYYDSWQFLVNGHPYKWEVVRHIPDALAAVAGERTI